MMKNKTSRRDLLNELGLEESIVFENPDYDSAIIGYDDNTDRVVYGFEAMAVELAEQDGIDYDESIEFIEYNTLRAIPYAGSNPPIVLQRIDDYMDYHNYEKEEDNYEYDFNVTMDEEKLEKDDEWKTGGSLKSKAKRYGINYGSNGLQLCFGKGDKKRHKFLW